MKNKMLEIIRNLMHFYVGTPIDDEPYEVLAKEIDILTHDHYMEFVEWKDKTCKVFNKKYVDSNNGVWYIFGRDNIEHTLEEVYQYWKDNVLNK